MKILVTGATGFVGNALSLRLKALGHEVLGTGRNLEAGQMLQEQGIHFAACDLRQPDAIADLCQHQDIVFHCAALSAPWGKYTAFYQANVMGTLHVIQGCMEHNIQRLIHVSTPSIYFDEQDRMNVKEDDPLPPKPISLYAKTKLMAEGFVDQAHENGLNVVTIRPRAIFGPGDPSIFPRLLKRLERGQLRIIGEGDNVADLTYIDNVVDALVLCMDSGQHTLGKKYNISSGQPVPLWDMICLLCEKLDHAPPTQFVPYKKAMRLAGFLEWLYGTFFFGMEPPITRFAATALAKSQTLNIDAARQDLGYEPKISTEAGINRFVEWWKDQAK